MKTSPTIICLTPVKNEAWILDRFLQCASTWADHIIIADQQSDDGSREIAKKYSKVTLIDNVSLTYNELERQKVLIAEARKISGPRLIIALDADEFLTSEGLEHAEWKTVLESQPGTIIQLRWINLLPDMRLCWIPEEDKIFGFMDDNISEHVGKVIHSSRVPIPERASVLSLRKIKVLHYQYTDWQRMQSKHRWYQMWEIINVPNKSSISIYRQYHHMYSSIARELLPVETDWFRNYTNDHIDMTSVSQPTPYWWDEDVIRLLEKHHPRHFRKLDIWDLPWSNRVSNNDLIEDPRSRVEKLVHIWLAETQSMFHPLSAKNNKIVFLIAKAIVLVVDKTLMQLGW